MDLIIDRDAALLLAARRGGTLPVHGLGVGAYRLDIAYQITGHGQQVAAQIRQRTAGMPGVATPGPG
ncbi:hypothetical protein D3C85_1777380 [compost metagenome]